MKSIYKTIKYNVGVTGKWFYHYSYALSDVLSDTCNHICDIKTKFVKLFPEIRSSPSYILCDVMSSTEM